MQCLNCLAENLDTATHCIACGSPLDSSKPGTPNVISANPHPSSLIDLPLGTLLKGSLYRIEALLGRGGFGITYKGVSTQNGSVVAIKELWPQGARQGNQVVWPPTIQPQEKREQIRAFFIEAANQHKCKHRHIAQVYDWFEENNTAYIVLQFIAGKSLFNILAEEGPLDEARVKRYFLQVAEALQVVHAQNFQHRDIKPDNILIDSQDQAVLIDFGAAREFIAGQTKRLTVLLTPGYAPLEQYSQQGKRFAASDFYAFAASMYELLTGELPADAVQRSSSSPDPLVSPRQINPRLSAATEQVILTAMKVKVEERFQCAEDLIDALNGNFTSPSQRKAQELVKQGKLADAARVYARCLKDDPTNKSAVLEYALVSIHLDPAQAQVAAEMSIRLNPQEGLAYGVLGLAYCQQENWPDAASHLQQAARLNPGQVWILANWAWALGKLGQWTTSAQVVDKALQLEPNCAFALGIQAWIAFQHKKYKAQVSNEAAVIPCVIKALAQNPPQELQQWLYPYLFVALAQVTHPLTGSSLQSQINKCLDHIPDHSFAWGFRGWQEASSQLFTNARVSWEKACQSDSPSIWTLANLGIAQEYLGNVTAAVQVYEFCSQQFPDSAFSYYRLGTLAARSQQWEQAKAYLETAIQLDNKYASAYHNLGWVLLNYQNSQGEREDSRQVIGAYKAAIEAYRQQNRLDLAQLLEQAFAAAEITL